MTMLHPFSPPPLPSRPRSHLRAGAAALLLGGMAWGMAWAEPPAEESWTGRPQDAATARKEASAALVEGRRECARQPAAERTACLKLVQEEHAAALKRLGAATPPRPKR